MIYLTTGQPGHGKTLWTIWHVEKLARESKRQVYYSGIKVLPGSPLENWIEHDPEKWYELPPNSIMVIDECQKVFRPRSVAVAVPKHEEELETHRHGGVDLFLITQHPMFTSTHVRRLTHEHRHIVNIFGLKASTVHCWNAVRDDCDKAGRREDSNSVKWPYPKHVYGWYKSAEVHTGRRSIPKAVYTLAALPILIGGAVWYMADFTQKFTKSGGSGVPKSEQVLDAAVGVPGQMSDTKTFDPVQDAKLYVAMNTPRVTGLQHTAPKYDELTRPAAVPVPAACVHRGDRCQCYSQQGTRLDVEHNQCLEITYNGYFQEFNPNGNERRDNERTVRSVQVLNAQDRLPISGASTKDTPNLADGYGVLGKAGPGVRVPSL